MRHNGRQAVQQQFLHVHLVPHLLRRQCKGVLSLILQLRRLLRLHTTCCLHKDGPCRCKPFRSTVFVAALSYILLRTAPEEPWAPFLSIAASYLYIIRCEVSRISSEATGQYCHDATQGHTLSLKQPGMHCVWEHTGFSAQVTARMEK